MKKYLSVLLISCVAIIAISCKKTKPVVPVINPTKTVRFVLYTNEDFSTDNDTISFRLTIRNNAGMTSSRTIFDSTLNTIRFKDIPNPAHKIIIEKTVPDNGSVLSAGFIYTDRFGVGSYFDTLAVSQKIKVLEYAFR